MLGSTSRGGEFQKHQITRPSTSRSKNSPKTNRWKHPVSGLQQAFFSQMNVKIRRPLSTCLGDLNTWWLQQLNPRDGLLRHWINGNGERFFEATQFICQHIQSARDVRDLRIHLMSPHKLEVWSQHRCQGWGHSETFGSGSICCAIVCGLMTCDWTTCTRQVGGNAEG